MYIDFVCTNLSVAGDADVTICIFDAWENYDLLCAFYDACPECQSFPKEEYFTEGSQANWEDYVIFENGVIAARAGIWKASDTEWEVAGVITRPEYRGRGYAQQLVRYCVMKILENGKTAVLSTHETNAAMIRAALKAGFAVKENPT